MSVAAGQVNKSAFTQDIYPAAVREMVAHDIFTHLCRFGSHSLKVCHINFTVEMTCIAKDGSVLDHRKILFINDFVAAGYGNKNVSDPCSFLHRHNIESVHYSLDGLHGIDLGNHNSCAESFRAHCGSLSAPAVTCNYNDFTGYDQVRGSVDAVPNRLSGAVTVVKEMLAVRVVYLNHRELKLIVPCHGFQSEDTGCGFFASADNIRDQVAEFGMHHVNQIAAVIDDDIGADL